MFPKRLASLNIQTLHNSTRLVSFIKVLTDYDVDIACLQETLNLGEGIFHLQNYTFFYKGEERPDPKPKHGVGIAIKRNLLEKIAFSNGSILTKRIYHLILTINGTLHIHIISVYAPQKDLSVDEKDEFYDILTKIISKIPVSEIVFVLGDYNAHVGKENMEGSNIIGPFGYGEMNEEGDRLLSFCKSNHLVIANTYSDIPEEERYTYQSGNGVRTQLDLCIIRQCDLKCISKCFLINHNLQQLSHRMLIVDLNKEELIKTAQMTQNEKLLLELKYQLNALHKNNTTENFEKAWQLFRKQVDETLLKIIRSNETKIRLSLSDVVLRNERLKEQGTDFDYESEKIDFDKSFSELFKNLRLKDAVIPSLNNSNEPNDSIFNYDFTIEMAYEATVNVTSLLNEISVDEVIEAINSVIRNTATIISTLSIHPEDLKEIFQPEGSFFKLLQRCWQEGIIPQKILLADVFKSHVTHFSNTIFVFSVFSEIFQRCIYIKLKTVIQQQESRHGFIMSFSQREFLFAINLMYDKILNMDNVFIALLDFSKLTLALETNAIIKYLQKNIPDGIAEKILQFLKSFLVKSKMSTKAGKKNNEKSNIYKITMQFFWSCLLTACLEEGNVGVLFNTFERASPYRKDILRKPWYIKGIIYVDLLLFMSNSMEGLKNNLERVNEYLNKIGLDYGEVNVTISANKIGSYDDTSDIFNCFGKQIKLSPSITILGRSFGSAKELRDVEIFSRIQTAYKETDGMQYSIKPSEDINVTLKRYMANILEPLLLNLDIVTLDSSQEDLLNRFHFHNFFVREIQDRKIFVRQSCLLPTKSIPTILSYRRLVLFGALTRLTGASKVNRLFKSALFTRGEEDKFLSLCDDDLGKFKITYETCETMDRVQWIKTLDEKLFDLE